MGTAGSSKLEAKVMVSVALSLEPQASCLKLMFGAVLAPEICWQKRRPSV